MVTSDKAESRNLAQVSRPIDSKATIAANFHRSSETGASLQWGQLIRQLKTAITSTDDPRLTWGIAVGQWVAG